MEEELRDSYPATDPSDFEADGKSLVDFKQGEKNIESRCIAAAIKLLRRHKYSKHDICMMKDILNEKDLRTLNVYILQREWMKLDKIS